MDAGITRPAHGSVAGHRVALWLAVALCVVGGLVTSAGSLLGSAQTTDSAVPSAFAGRAFPVRGIEYERDEKSGNRLVRVRCGGRAARVSYCWVSAPGRHS